MIMGPSPDGWPDVESGEQNAAAELTHNESLLGRRIVVP